MHSYILHILKRFRKAVQSYMLMLYAKHGSTARQLDSSTARQLGQTSTDLDSYSTPRRMQSASTGSTATRQLLDSYLTGSTSKALRTAPRQRLDGCSGGALPLETGPDRSPDTAMAARQGSTRAQVVKRVRNVWVAAA